VTSNYTLTLSCRNRPGLVASVAGAIFHNGGDILDAQQFDDRETGRFFMRVAFETSRPRQELEDSMAQLMREREMVWRMPSSREKQKVNWTWKWRGSSPIIP
jgi:formyltetrahydrofolate deformylase